jgi:GDPmannose 4,6-dehydratase
MKAGQTALVTGVTGQVGHYVAEILTRAGLNVVGLVRQSTTGRAGRGAAELPYRPVPGDLLDEYSLLSLLEETRPDYIFNFGAQSFIPASWTQPILTAQYTGLGVVRLMEAVRRAVPHCRVLQAGSSEMFALSGTSPQDESTPLRPRNPYGVAKAFAYHTMLCYRQHYDLFATNAIFYTNESPRRSTEFLFRKVTRAVAEIVAKKREQLSLGNLDTVRDWGFGPEFANVAVQLLCQPAPDDFVVATGQGHTIQQMVERAFALVDLSWRDYVHIDTSLVRSSEPAPLIGNSDKLRRQCGITIALGFEEVLRLILAYDLRREGLRVPFELPDSPYRSYVDA